MSNLSTTGEPEKLPELADLIKDENLAKVYEATVFEHLVNQPPPETWVRIHPVITTKDKNGKDAPYLYLPIERIEWLLINIVRRYKVKVKDVKQIANSVVVTVKLKYWHPVYNEWTSHDGIGAAPLQTDKGAGAINWDKIKNNAVQIGAPAAESFAVKDAAEKIGRLFGRDLNRKDMIPFDGMLAKVTDKYEKLLKKDDGKQD